MNFLIYEICFVIVCTVAGAPDTLRFVNVVYRHGDRSPVGIYPNDPYQADTWPQGLGWLSEIGMHQQFELGQFLRTEYGNFLNSAYKNTEFVVESSETDRCLMSAYCNLAGLYPPSGDQVWNRNISWQPIPVHTRPNIEDNKLALEKPCVLYDELYAKELTSPFVKEEERTNAAFYTFLDEKTGVKRENISVVWEVADTVFVENAHNLTLPNWTQAQWGNGTVYSKLMELRDLGFFLLYNGTMLSRLKGGPLLKDFIQNMQNFTANEQQYKMHMYSAHDVTIAAVLDAMNVYNKKAPPYASAVLVELHNISNQYCVKMRFRNNTENAPYTLIHPGCQQECCPLDKYVEVTKPRVPVNWDAECKNHVNNDSGDDSPVTGTVLALIIAVGVLVLLFMFLVISYCRQRRMVKSFETI